MLLLIIIGSALGSQPQVSSDLFLNKLNMSFGINYKYSGFLYHNIHRVWIITKVAPSKVKRIFPFLILHLTQIVHLFKISSILGQLLDK